MALSSLTLLTATLVAAIVYVDGRRKWLHRLRGFRLPPGPRGWPIIGSLLDVPSGERPWLVYYKWAQKYGDIIFFRVLNTPMMMISSADIILELTERRSSLYSDKPPLVIDKMTGWDFNMATMPYGKQWRSIRRMLHLHFNQTVTSKYREKQTKEVHAYLRRCMEHPAGKPLDPLSLRLMLATIILDIVYGLQIESMDDNYVKLAIESVTAFSESRVPNRYWVEYMPFLRHIPPWVPGAAAAKAGAWLYPKAKEMINSPFDAIKQQLREMQTPYPSITLDFISSISQEIDPIRREELEQHAKCAAGIAYAAGADTTYSLIQTFFCCMARYPDLQKRAREELDAVVGPDRLPTYDDSDSLPYVHAIVMECSRWLPVVPLSMPRRTLTDDYFEDYFIPKGTLIIANVWQILRDPQDYPDPERFYPDRFMKDGALNPKVRDPHTIAFGFGRRNCPGRHLAKDTAFLTIASLLHTFDILPTLDENGNVMDTMPQMTTGLLCYPDRMNFTLKPRSGAAAGLVSATAP